MGGPARPPDPVGRSVVLRCDADERVGQRSARSHMTNATSRSSVVSTYRCMRAIRPEPDRFAHLATARTAGEASAALDYGSVMTPLETVDEFMRRFCTMDVDHACELVADDVEYDNVPIGKQYGPDGIKAFAGAMVDRFDSIEFVVHRSAAAGGVVLNERTDRFVTGERTFDIPVAGVFEVDDAGLITLWRDYFDMGPVDEMFEALAD